MSSLRTEWPSADNLHTGFDTMGVAVSGAVVRRLYCVGMAGTGMKAIAEWFAAAGWQVCGSDRSATAEVIAKFHRRGIRLFPEHSAGHLPPLTDVLIYSPAVPETNPERQAALAHGIPQWSYPQALGQLMQDREGISIAGTHGKSTTTALVGHLLRHAGLAPSILCGAEMLDTGLNGVLGEGGLTAHCDERKPASSKIETNVAWAFAHACADSLNPRGLKPTRPLLVAESCEYRGHFLELSPRIVGLLGIEPDHFDCFPTFDLALETYRTFLERMPATGLLVANLDCEATCSIVPSCSARKVFVSTTDPRADYFVEHVETTAAGVSLAVHLPDRSTLELHCPQWGNHHAINLVTALAIAMHLGVDRETCLSGFAGFAGIGRRFEYRGHWGGLTWIDDYAHHPSAVKAVIDAARDRYPDRRIWCAFQPHQISRTRELAEGFVTSLQRADGILVLPVFGAREVHGTERIDLSRQLVDGINHAGVPAHFVFALDRLRVTIETHTRPGDVVLTVGAGDIDRIYHEFTGRLQTHHAS